MAFTGNNQTLFNAAMDGALAGMMAGRDMKDATQNDYNAVASAALSYATEVDAQIAADATLTAAGATVIPASAANQQNFNAKSHLMQAISFGVWHGRSGTDNNNPDYLVLAKAVAAAYAAAVAAYANAPGGTSLS